MADDLFKVLITGDSAVGKSNIMSVFSEGVFAESFHATIGVSFATKLFSLQFEDKRRDVKMQIWDTAGQERYRSITASYYRGAHGMFIVYDITERATFENAFTIWLKEARARLGEDVPIVVVGNKCDLEDQRVVSIEEAEGRAEEMGTFFMETSAKQNHNVGQAFELLAVKILSGMLKRSSYGSSRPKLDFDGADVVPISEQDIPLDIRMRDNQQNGCGC